MLAPYARAYATACAAASAPVSFSSAVDTMLAQLMHGGLLTRQLAEGCGFWISIPNVGGVVRQLVGGRRDIRTLLSKRPYQEMLQSSLEKLQLRSSKLGWRFHIREAIGGGTLTTAPTVLGPVLRIGRP